MMLNSVRWLAPVMVSFLPRAERQFDCVHDALDYLEHEWPTPGGRHHTRARQLLRLALARQISAEEAREAFVAACIEANVLGTQHIEIIRRRPRREPARNASLSMPAMGAAESHGGMETGARLTS